MTYNQATQKVLPILFWFTAIFCAMSVGARVHHPDALLWVNVVNLVLFAGLGTYFGLRSLGATVKQERDNVS